MSDELLDTERQKALRESIRPTTPEALQKWCFGVLNSPTVHHVGSDAFVAHAWKYMSLLAGQLGCGSPQERTLDSIIDWCTEQIRRTEPDTETPLGITPPATTPETPNEPEEFISSSPRSLIPASEAAQLSPTWGHALTLSEIAKLSQRTPPLFYSEKPNKARLNVDLAEIRSYVLSLPKTTAAEKEQASSPDDENAAIEAEIKAENAKKKAQRPLN